MVGRDLRVSDSAAHQPTKAEMEQDVSIDSPPAAFACGGAERSQDKTLAKKS